MLFLVPLPFFWAILLAPGITRQALRSIAAGTCILLVSSVVLMLFQVVHTFIIQLNLAVPAIAATTLRLSERLVLNVIPFVLPVLLAFGLNADLRTRVFSRQIVPAPSRNAETPQQRVVRRGSRRRKIAEAG